MIRRPFLPSRRPARPSRQPQVEHVARLRPSPRTGPDDAPAARAGPSRELRAFIARQRRGFCLVDGPTNLTSLAAAPRR